MILTTELIHSIGSSNGNGWNRQQIELMGIKFPPRKGWLSSLQGKLIPDEKWSRIVELSGVHKVRKRKEIINGQKNLF